MDRAPGGHFGRRAIKLGLIATCVVIAGVGARRLDEQMPGTTRLRWASSQLLLGDVTRDGSPDLTGFLEYTAGGRPEILASFQGGTGAWLWSRELPDGFEGTQLRATWAAPGMVLVSGRGGRLLGLSGADGAIMWRAELGGVIEKICDSIRPSSVVVITRMRAVHEFDLATGVATQIVGVDYTDCQELASAGPVPATKSPAPVVPRTIGNVDIDRTRLTTANALTIGIGVSRVISQALALVAFTETKAPRSDPGSESSARVSGSKLRRRRRGRSRSAATAVPVADRAEPTVAWVKLVAKDPALQGWLVRSPESSWAIGETHIAVMYATDARVGADRCRLAGFRIADGARTFEVVVPSDGWLETRGDSVIFATAQSASVYELSTGRHQLSVRL